MVDQPELADNAVGATKKYRQSRLLFDVVGNHNSEARYSKRMTKDSKRLVRRKLNLKDAVA